MGEVRRKINFLKVQSEGDDFGDLLNEVNAISGPEMYSFIDGSGGGIFLKSLDDSSDMCSGVVARLRMSDLPSLGRQNMRATEQLALAEDQGLVECTHFIYFKRSGILAMEYNHHGPRASTLEWHVIGKINGLRGEPAGFSFQYIFDRGTFDALSQSSEVKLLQMAVPKEKIQSLAAFDASIHAAFENAAVFGNEGKVELILRMPRSSGSGISGSSLLNKIRSLPGIPKDTFSTLKVKVKPADDRMQALDLLEGKFVVNVSVETVGRSNELNSRRIFREIREAYQLQRENLIEMAEYEQLD